MRKSQMFTDRFSLRMILALVLFWQAVYRITSLFFIEDVSFLNIAGVACWSFVLLAVGVLLLTGFVRVGYRE